MTDPLDSRDVSGTNRGVAAETCARGAGLGLRRHANGESHENSDLDLAVRSPGLEPLGGGFLNLLEPIEESNIPILVQTHGWARLPEGFHHERAEPHGVPEEGECVNGER